MKLFNFCNKVIEYSFYFLFFLIPLAFTSDTSELFEFNKLWLTFIITIVIGAAWITKMIIRKEFRIQRTPLDIPILLFLASEIISSFLSLDMHVSLWGYYSRFNGGLFSIFAYVFLYYAFVSNLKDVIKEEKAKFEFKKVYLFLAAIAVFIIGLLVSSQIKNPDLAGIPYQGLATLVTVLASFSVFMLAAPTGTLRRSLYAVLTSALLVILWGLPSHFGYDPTCLLFRGTLDVSCWTTDFQPKIRIFSTLGQPDWLAAYVAALLPLITALFINSLNDAKLVFNKTFSFLKTFSFWLPVSLFVFFAATYVALLYTQSRSAILALWVVLPVFLLVYAWFYLKPKFDRKKLSLQFKIAVLIFLSVGIIPFLFGQPFTQLTKLTLPGIVTTVTTKLAPPAKTTVKVAPTPAASPVSSGELGGTDSSKIRLLVWKGAVDIWLHNPVFGSGLETFAFAYYQYRPAAHNMTSEAKFLYNKAHNEYLNYLATTGTIGIATYLMMIGSFLFLSLKHLFAKRKKLNAEDLLALSLIAGYGTILITNFFGFSVVMVNILFYLFPAFVFILLGKINYNKALVISLTKKENYDLSLAKKALIAAAIILAAYLIYTLITDWNADRDYYYGMGYDNPSIAAYDKAYPFLKQAVATRPSEPTFLDEFAYNNAILGASVLAQQAQAGQQANPQNQQVAKQLIDAAIADTNQVTTQHPNDIVFWKTKVRVFYTLSQVNPAYLPLALEAVKKAAQLAPTDADVSYNLGILYGQNGDSKNAVATLQNTIKLKPDYSQAYYALGIFYHQLAIDKTGKVVDESYNQKAIAEMNLLIKYFGPNQQASDAIKAWGTEK
jgi:putative inorganic carbon (HCO3(-)) transporter